MQLANLIQTIGKTLSDNSPTILSGIAVTTSIATVVLATKASFSAAEDIRDEEIIRERTTLDSQDLTIREKVELVWPYYVPVAVTGTVTVVCIIAANRIGNRRAAAMAAAYTMSREAFAEYKDKVVERLGETKEQKMRDEIAQDQVNRNPVSNNELHITNTGDVICYDSITGRYFKSNVETIRRAENQINRQIIHDMSASVSDFYNHIGLPTTPYTNQVGWNTDYPLEIKFSSVLADDGVPCVSINYEVYPMRGYDVIF